MTVYGPVKQHSRGGQGAESCARRWNPREPGPAIADPEVQNCASAQDKLNCLSLSARDLDNEFPDELIRLSLRRCTLSSVSQSGNSEEGRRHCDAIVWLCVKKNPSYDDCNTISLPTTEKVDPRSGNVGISFFCKQTQFRYTKVTFWNLGNSENCFNEIQWQRRSTA